MRGPVRLTLLALLTVATIGSWAVLTLLVAPVAGARRAVRRGAL